MSEAAPARPSAVRSRIACLSASAMPPSGHRIAPGETPLTRTVGPSSQASVRVIIASPALEML